MHYHTIGCPQNHKPQSYSTVTQQSTPPSHYTVWTTAFVSKTNANILYSRTNKRLSHVPSKLYLVCQLLHVLINHSINHKQPKEKKKNSSNCKKISSQLALHQKISLHLVDVGFHATLNKCLDTYATLSTWNPAFKEKRRRLCSLIKVHRVCSIKFNKWQTALVRASIPHFASSTADSFPRAPPCT